MAVDRTGGERRGLNVLRARFHAGVGRDPSPTILVDGLRVVAANPAACALFGRDEAELALLEAVKLTDDGARWDAHVDPVRRGGEPMTWWRASLRVGDRLVPAGVTATAVERADDPGDCALVVRLSPMADAERPEAHLAAAEDLFRTTFDGAPIGMAIVGVDGRWLSVNPTTCRMLGRTEAELLASTFQELTHPDDLDADVDLLRETVAGARRGYTMEKRYLHPDGSVVWVNLATSLLRDHDGRPRFFVSQIEDITARKIAERDLRRVRDQLERVVAHAAVAMAVVTRDGAVVEANSRFGQLLGVEVGRAPVHLGAVLGPRARDEVEYEIRRVESGGAPGSLEVTVCDDRPLRVRLEIALLPTDGDPAFIVQAVDVTAHHLARLELEHLATHDPLTGLLNRRGFAALVDLADPDARSALAVLYVDLDDFKDVNDAFGHDEGDRVLVDVANALRDVVRSTDVVARLGGDEFAVLLRGARPAQTASTAARVHSAIAAVVSPAGPLSASVGIATGRGCESRAAERLLREADDALLAAKRAGKGRSVVAPTSPSS